jgi:hypothetical protein
MSLPFALRPTIASTGLDVDKRVLNCLNAGCVQDTSSHQGRAQPCLGYKGFAGAEGKRSHGAPQ